MVRLALVMLLAASVGVVAPPRVAIAEETELSSQVAAARSLAATEEETALAPEAPTDGVAPESEQADDPTRETARALDGTSVQAVASMHDVATMSARAFGDAPTADVPASEGEAAAKQDEQEAIQQEGVPQERLSTEEATPKETEIEEDRPEVACKEAAQPDGGEREAFQQGTAQPEAACQEVTQPKETEEEARPEVACQEAVQQDEVEKEAVPQGEAQPEAACQEAAQPVVVQAPAEAPSPKADQPGKASPLVTQQESQDEQKADEASAQEEEAQPLPTYFTPQTNVWYRIRSAVKGSKLFLDAKGGRTASGTNLQCWTSSKANRQLFMFVPDPYSADAWEIRNAAGARYVDIAGGKAASRANVQLNQSNSTATQRWQLVCNPGGTIGIRSLESGLMLAVAGGSKSKGANAEVYTANGKRSQRWLLEIVYEDLIESGLYAIAANSKPSVVLGVRGASKKNEANVQASARSGSIAQRWWVTSVAPDTYQIEAVCSGRMLGVKGASKDDGANIQVVDARRTAAQRWRAFRQQDGGVGLRNVASGKVLKIAGDIPTTGANVRQNAEGLLATQSLRFVPVNAVSSATKLSRAIASWGIYGIYCSAVSKKASIPNVKVSVAAPTGAKITGARVRATGVQDVVISRACIDAHGGDIRAVAEQLMGFVCDTGNDRATKPTTLYHVMFPQGTFKLSEVLHVYSNTWLDLRAGTTLVRDFEYGSMLRGNKTANQAGGYGLISNVLVTGGTWNANSARYHSRASTSMRFGHGHDIAVIGSTFVGCHGSHMIELGGISGATVSGCAFSNTTGDAQKEAIQIESINNSVGSPTYGPYDDTMAKNIVVRNNSFTKVGRGVGHHSTLFGCYNTRVLIENNRFVKLANAAISLPTFRAFVIRNNTIRNCGAGIEVLAMAKSIWDAHTGTKAKYRADARALISHNEIVTNRRGSTEHYGILLAGRRYNGRLYKLTHVRLTGNSIRAAGTRIKRMVV